MDYTLKLGSLPRRENDFFNGLLGVTLYEVLAGKLPHLADSTPELLRRITRDAPAPLTKHRPDLPVSMEGIVARMMSKRPKDRPTAQEIHDMLAGGAVPG